MSGSGYFFRTEAEAQEALDAINAHYGIPASNDAATRNYTEYIQWGDGWAIMADDSIVAVLGDAVELPEIDELTTNND